jgi:hypothetical protein
MSEAYLMPRMLFQSSNYEDEPWLAPKIIMLLTIRCELFSLLRYFLLLTHIVDRLKPGGKPSTQAECRRCSTLAILGPRLAIPNSH